MEERIGWYEGGEGAVITDSTFIALPMRGLLRSCGGARRGSAAGFRVVACWLGKGNPNCEECKVT